MQFVYFYPRHASDHSRFNCSGGSRKTIHKRSEDGSVTEDEKILNLGLLRGKDKMTHLRVIENSLRNEGYITIPEFKEDD